MRERVREIEAEPSASSAYTYSYPATRPNDNREVRSLTDSLHLHSPFPSRRGAVLLFLGNGGEVVLLLQLSPSTLSSAFIFLLRLFSPAMKRLGRVAAPASRARANEAPHFFLRVLACGSLAW